MKTNSQLLNEMIEISLKRSQSYKSIKSIVSID